jgi:hypothetical protein
VRQQVDDGQAVAHHGIVQLDLGYVVPERTFPVEQAVIDESPDRGRGEGHDLTILDGGESAARDLPGGQLVADEPFDALHVLSFYTGFRGGGR